MSATFIDHRLDDGVAYGFSGGPRWNTRRIPLRNGQERRNQLWAAPLHEYQAQYTTLKEELQAEILHALWVARGSLRSFRFKDWNDFAVVGAEGALEAPATDTAPIQLTKTYTFGSESEVRDITLPLSVALYADEVLFEDYSVDPLTGLLTPTTTWPTASLRWEGEFDVRVHFAEDYNELARSRVKVSSATVRLEEVRE